MKMTNVSKNSVDLLEITVKKLKGKEYIHSTGTWKKDIDYLKKE